jgi:hypothetical protein
MHTTFLLPWYMSCSKHTKDHLYGAIQSEKLNAPELVKNVTAPPSPPEEEDTAPASTPACPGTKEPFAHTGRPLSWMVTPAAVGSADKHGTVTFALCTPAGMLVCRFRATTAAAVEGSEPLYAVEVEEDEAVDHFTVTGPRGERSSADADSGALGPVAMCGATNTDS